MNQIYGAIVKEDKLKICSGIAEVKAILNEITSFNDEEDHSEVEIAEAIDNARQILDKIESLCV